MMKIGTRTQVLSIMLAASVGLAGCATVPTESAEAMGQAVKPISEGEDAVVADLLARMSIERKVGQLIQPQINSFTAQDMEQYRFGSFFNGGNGGPGGDEFAPAANWLALADEMFEASIKPMDDGEPVIPTMWGTDAVHGHTNIVGATIFPHNVALGATGDADLVRRIGAATAIEIEATGMDWNFSPTVAVARDDRWGRTYESYSENPDLVAKLGAALVEGLQGRPGSAEYLGDGKVLATAKHFFGDGGTERGVDQGDVNGDIDDLVALHARPYPAAIAAGVQTIMASFNSVNGEKMHGNRALLTGLLREKMEFRGLVVGDWNAHGQVAGCTVDNCPQALLAGLDIYMVPDDWRALYDNLVSQVRDGTIPMERLDQAVGNVLRMKYRAGLLGPDVSPPSRRGVGGRLELIGSADHRALAREAVARSQVILKNDGVLPLRKGMNVLVAGKAADNVGQASGGWTLEWQGMAEPTSEMFPNSTSIWEGIRESIASHGGMAALSVDGSFETRPDVAIVVFGERPYAEFAGDLRDMVFRDEEGLKLLRDFRLQGIPTVAVFLSGRPLWMNREINAADAFVASWLPGSEGGGIADVLVGDRPATGRLSFSWPAECDGSTVNGPEGALFAFGFGRTLDDHSSTPALGEECHALASFDASELFNDGRLATGVVAYAAGGNLKTDADFLAQMRGNSGAAGVSIRGIDRDAQEDAREIHMLAGSRFGLMQEGANSGAYHIVYEVGARPKGRITLKVGESGPIDLTRHFDHATEKGWREMIITNACAPGLGQKIEFAADAEITFRIASIRREDGLEDVECSF